MTINLIYIIVNICHMLPLQYSTMFNSPEALLVTVLSLQDIYLGCKIKYAMIAAAYYVFYSVRTQF